MTELYKKMLDTLRCMDEKQLLELFHDISELEVVERIADGAYKFIEHMIYVVPARKSFEVSQINNPESWDNDCNEHKEADDARRHREHEESERRNY